MPNAESPTHKTLAIRLTPEVHAQLVLVAQLDGATLVEEIRQAIQAHLEHKRAEGGLEARAQAALVDLDRETAERKQAIQALFGAGQGDSAAASPAPKSRRPGTSSG